MPVEENCTIDKGLLKPAISGVLVGANTDDGRPVVGEALDGANIGTVLLGTDVGGVVAINVGEFVGTINMDGSEEGEIEAEPIIVGTLVGTKGDGEEGAKLEGFKEMGLAVGTSEVGAKVGAEVGHGKV